MNYYETHFDNYLVKNEKANLHPELDNITNILTKTLDKFTNIILYGPEGTGKYSYALSILQSLSPSKLKYEKKLLIPYNKNDYFIKISDVHFEVDMSLLGCNSKLLWHDIYTQIVDILYTTPNKRGVILCKNFHEIQNELLEIFYSYMQKNDFSIQLYFMIITKELSFIPKHISNSCKIINSIIFKITYFKI